MNEPVIFLIYILLIKKLISAKARDMLVKTGICKQKYGRKDLHRN
ncbi:protein of unknown function [Lactiplantibacillus plantarum]